MCCKPKLHHSSHMNHYHHVQHSCCCSSSKEDRVERLERRLSDLQDEAKAIEERIAHIKNCG